MHTYELYGYKVYEDVQCTYRRVQITTIFVLLKRKIEPSKISKLFFKLGRFVITRYYLYAKRIVFHRFITIRYNIAAAVIELQYYIDMHTVACMLLFNIRTVWLL